MRWQCALVSILILFILDGCKASPPRDDFYSGNYAAAISKSRETIAANPTGKDYAYHRLFLASAAFYAGDYSQAQQALREAIKVMERYGEDSSGEIMAMVGSETSKVYKGDPYEQMMAHYYVGMTYFFAGDYTKALAGFTNALSADEMSPDDIYKRDCVLMFFMAAKAALKLAREDSANGFIREALASTSQNACLDLANIKSSNLLVIVETGRGPFKRTGGPGDSLEILVPVESPDQSVKVYLDDKPLGDAVAMADIYLQAKTCGQSKATAIREAKGVARELTAGMPLVTAKADIRAWTFLPGKVFVLCAPVTKGIHSITLKFYDENGIELSEYEHTQENFDIQDEKIFYFRTVKPQ